MLKQEPGCLYLIQKRLSHLSFFMDLLLMACKLYGDPCKFIFGQEMIPLRFKRELSWSPFHLVKAHKQSRCLISCYQSLAMKRSHILTDLLPYCFYCFQRNVNERKF